jgi:hypothetical protein
VRREHASRAIGPTVVFEDAGDGRMTAGTLVED